MDSQAIIDFWFNELDPSQWWVKSEQVDQLIRERFSDIHHDACEGALFHWRKTATGRLAEIIVLDQFSRNIYRDTPRAFTHDAMALVLAQEAIGIGADLVLAPQQKAFLYMPFMHSESLLIHNIAVQLFSAEGVETNLDFEQRHRDIIERFGRYPHRNRILGRESTPEEITFLEKPGSHF